MLVPLSFAIKLNTELPHLNYCISYVVASQILLIVIPSTFISDQGVEGRLGPSTVVLDHTSGFEGLLLVDDDLLGVSVR